MRIAKLSDMTRGWFVGDFEPSIYRTKKFEVGILSHKKDEVWPAHIHKVATEINVLISGKMQIQNTIIEPGTVFMLEPYEVGDPIFLEDCTVVTVKTPSVIGDKYNV